jgi:hypothetical protein
MMAYLSYSSIDIFVDEAGWRRFRYHLILLASAALLLLLAIYCVPECPPV